MHAHNTHVTALAHLELALAALDTLPTDGKWQTIVDSIKNPKEALQKAKEAIAARVPEYMKKKAVAVSESVKSLAKAAVNDNQKAMAALKNTTLGKALAKSRGGQVAAGAIKAATSESESAKSEHKAHKTHSDDVKQAKEFRVADRQTYLITSGPFAEDIEEEKRIKDFEQNLRKNGVDESTITHLRMHGVHDMLELLIHNESWWNKLSAAGKQQLQRVIDQNNDYSDNNWKRSNHRKSHVGHDDKRHGHRRRMDI
jgi:hypothetical protein